MRAIQSPLGGVQSALPLRGFNPASLFLAGEQGFWLDPSDLKTLFQDSAGTTPVAAAGDPVGLILDKSGRGNNALQATGTLRPTYQVDSTGRPYLQFDGSDDFLATAAFDPAVDRATVVVGFRKLSDATRAIIVESGNNGLATDPGSLIFQAPGTNGLTNVGIASRGDAVSGAFAAVSGFTAPITLVGAGIYGISDDTLKIRINGTERAFTVSDQGAGNFGNYQVNIGRRGTGGIAFGGRVYGLILRFASTDLNLSLLQRAESWMNGKTGAY